MTEKSPRPIKVIITDDHKLYRMGLRTIACQVPAIEVIGEAENGQQLLDMLKRVTPDIITLNFQMPVLNGLETLPLIRQSYPGIRVIMVSMHNDPGIIRKAMELGANAYLTKEARSEEVRDAIFTCTRQWLYLNKRVISALGMVTEVQVMLSPSGLTDRELSVCMLLQRGFSVPEIAISMGDTSPIIKATIKSMKQKTGVKSSQELVSFCQKKGILLE